MPPVKVMYTTLTRPLVVYLYHAPQHGTVGSEVALWQVPARPTDQRGLTYTFSDMVSKVLCIAAQVLVGASAI